MQEMQDKTLAEIAKAFTGSFIYAPGGTVNIGCNIFEGQAPTKKKAAPKAGSETNATAKPTRRRKSTTKVDEQVEPPKGDSAPPTDTLNDDDQSGDNSLTPTSTNPGPAGSTSVDAGSTSEAPIRPFGRPPRHTSRRRQANNNGG